ncbi:MAG: hypothetical protein NC204_07365 [Candidatus Amulumruptor caecigallinarius]|nr:hypothetical protein [Candidatus Amulumruptor caecigallinarius]
MLTLRDLQRRHSVRNYSETPLKGSLLNTLKAVVTDINSHEAGLNFQLITDDPAPFKGFMKSYGFFSGVNNYLAAVIDPAFDHAEERAGYCAEQFVMKAVKLGLGTCFVGGTFSRKDCSVQIRVYEKIPFVVTVGYPAEKVGLVSALAERMIHRNSKKPRDFFSGTAEQYEMLRREYDWFEPAIQAVALAPSALNKQPVRIGCIETGGKLKLAAYAINSSQYSDVELGIAKYNFGAIAPGFWEWGQSAQFVTEE